MNFVSLDLEYEELYYLVPRGWLIQARIWLEW